MKREIDIIIPIGISGSGKSTFIRSNFDKHLIVEPDAIREELTGDINDMSQDNLVWDITLKRMSLIADRYGIAVLDATNVYSKYRGKFLRDLEKLIKSYDRNPENIGIIKTAYVFDVDPEITYRRIRKDIRKGINRSDVPEEIVQKQYQHYINGKSNIEKQFDIVKYIE